MSDTKHTPGPWEAINTGPHWNNDKISNWTIQYGDSGEHIVDHVYSEEDARLIASAPALLEALEDIVWRYTEAKGIGVGDAVEAAKKLLATARA